MTFATHPMSTQGEANSESIASAVSWPAIFAGAFAAAALSVLLLTLGAGLGLSSVSPWSGASASMTAFTAGAAIWLIVVQWLSAGLGGYLAGRLRAKWSHTGIDEVFFRDTAHGFLAWAVATVFAAAIAASAVSSAVSGATRFAGSATTAALAGVSQGIAQTAADPVGYYVDAMFRSDRPAPTAGGTDTKAETARILARKVGNGSLSNADEAYLTQLVAARAGLPQDEAERRVNDVMAQIDTAEAKAREAAEEARKATAWGSYFLFFSMLIGAFVASAAAALGGQHRDAV